MYIFIYLWDYFFFLNVIKGIFYLEEYKVLLNKGFYMMYIKIIKI